MCPQKKLGIVIPFKELIKRALGFVRGAGRGEKEKKNLCGTWAYSSWELEYRLVAGNNTICNIRINSFISNFLMLPVLMGKDSDVNTVTRTSL